MNTHNIHSTDICRTQEEINDPEFTRFFWKNLAIAIGIGFFCTIGIIVLVLNVDKVDAFFAEIVKAIFI